MSMQKIIPHLWFDKEAKEAAEFYSSVFSDSKVVNVTTLYNTPSGDSDIVTFEVMGYTIQAISAGPYFKITPAISFMINFDPSKNINASTRIDEVWAKLIEGGEVLMEFGKYPFSDKYGWVQDKYGVSWQLILTDPNGEVRPLVMPSLLFVGDVCGKAEEATDFYMSVFKESKRGQISKYPAGMEPNKEGDVMFTEVNLLGQWIVAMDGGLEHKFSFNEAVSFIVKCECQDEIDYYWDKLSAVPEAEQCGWLKDKYGISWQIVPTLMDEMMKNGTEDQIKRVTDAFLQMKKFDIETLNKAYERGLHE